MQNQQQYVIIQIMGLPIFLSVTIMKTTGAQSALSGTWKNNPRAMVFKSSTADRGKLKMGLIIL